MVVFFFFFFSHERWWQWTMHHIHTIHQNIDVVVVYHSDCNATMIQTPATDLEGDPSLLKTAQQRCRLVQRVHTFVASLLGPQREGTQTRTKKNIFVSSSLETRKNERNEQRESERGRDHIQRRRDLTVCKSLQKIVSLHIPTAW